MQLKTSVMNQLEAKLFLFKKKKTIIKRLINVGLLLKNPFSIIVGMKL